MKMSTLIGLSALAGMAIGGGAGFSVAAVSLHRVYGNTEVELSRLLVASAEQLSNADGSARTAAQVVDSAAGLANLAALTAAQGYCAMDAKLRANTQAAARRLADSQLLAATNDRVGRMSRQYILATAPDARPCPEFRAPD